MNARTVRLLLWPAGVAIGVAAEAAYFGLGPAGRLAAQIVIVGWTLIACGLVAWSRRAPRRRSGTLLAATGFAWFAANFSDQALVPVPRPLDLVLPFPTGGRAAAGPCGWSGSRT